MQVLKQQFASEIPPMREFLHGEAHVWFMVKRNILLYAPDLHYTLICSHHLSYIKTYLTLKKQWA